MKIIINEWVFDGNHETTRAILEFMEQTDFKDKEVMDVGCGSGVLTIRAYELGAKHITAIDNDIRAVDNTRENIERNGITNADVYWTDFMETDLHADIILANLPRENALFCLPKMKKSLNENGILITSWYKKLPAPTGSKTFEFIGTDYDVYVIKERDINELRNKTEDFAGSRNVP